MLIDLDLDYFNPLQRPITVLEGLIGRIPVGTPTVVVVEHQAIIRPIRRWVSAGVLRTPFDWWHIDHHHDFYLDEHSPPGRWEPIDSANFGYYMPRRYYRRLVWVAVDGVDDRDDWQAAKAWMRSYGKQVVYKELVRFRFPEVPEAFVVTISPDYILYDDRTLAEMLAKIQDRFNVAWMPISKVAWNSPKWRHVNTWIRVRPERFHAWANTRWGLV